MASKIEKEWDRKLGKRFLGLLSSNPSQSVCMFHLGRSGSTVLSHLLNQHDEVLWDREIYRVPVTKVISWDENNKRKIAPLLPWVPKNYFLMRKAFCHAPLYGFETKFSHLSFLRIEIPKFIAQMKSVGAQYFITLKRKNYLKIVVSYLVAFEQNYFHLHKTEDNRIIKISINPNCTKLWEQEKSLMDIFERWDRCWEILDSEFEKKSPLELVYEEDIEQSPQKAYEKTCAYLNLEPKKVEIVFNRTNPCPLSQQVKNFEEIKEYFTNTKYEWMLEE